MIEYSIVLSAIINYLSINKLMKNPSLIFILLVTLASVASSFVLDINNG